MRKRERPMSEVIQFPVAGVQHADYQLVVGLKVGRPVRMFWERANTFDANAIRLEIDGVKIGYVPMKLTKVLHTYREAGIRLKAEVSMYNPNNPTYTRLHVKVLTSELLNGNTEDEL
jgi:hypothetical protein